MTVPICFNFTDFNSHNAAGQQHTKKESGHDNNKDGVAGAAMGSEGEEDRVQTLKRSLLAWGYLSLSLLRSPPGLPLPLRLSVMIMSLLCCHYSPCPLTIYSFLGLQCSAIIIIICCAGFTAWSWSRPEGRGEEKKDEPKNVRGGEEKALETAAKWVLL